MFVTEASCDACPRQCRAEIFRGKTSAPPGTACVLPVAGVAPAWVVGPQIPTPEPKIETTTAPPRWTTDRVLLACQQCFAPCLLEIQGPVSTGAVNCLAGYTKQTWRRTL